MSLTREQIKRIIIEEVLRALRELGVGDAVSGPPAEPGPPPFDYGPGVIILTGGNAPEGNFSAAMLALSGAGAPVEALLSLSFRQAQAARGPFNVPGAKPLQNPDDEPAAAAAIARARWVIVPDASANTLVKLVLGIEDSVPTRAIAEAMRLGKTILFSEPDPAEGAVPDPKRAEALRKLLVRGAKLARHGALPENLRDALDPPELRPYAPPPPPKPAPPRRIITFEDVFEAWRTGLPELVIAANDILTAEAQEQADRRGLAIRRAE